MARSRNPVPSYLHHKQRGKARAVWTDSAGVRHYRILPGAYKSQESLAAFARLQAELAASPLHVADDPASLSMSQVLLAYLEHAAQHYRFADGRPTSEIYEVKIVVKAVRELYGDEPVAEFGPLAVKAMRQKWIAEGRTRTECNRRVGMVKRILKWAVSEELVPVAVYQSVATVTGLQRGRTEAKETEPIAPVDEAVVEATMPRLNRHVAGLVQFQRLTGCRPGEACSIRRRDIDTGGDVWLYKPVHHKTAHRGKSRTIAIGPQAQALLRQFFTTNIDDFLFSPRRAMEEARGITEWKRSAKRMPRERYDRTSYTRAIARATTAAGVPHWHPNQLRHAYATKVRKEHGLEAAQVALGHARADVTQVYAERNTALAVEVAAKIG